MRHMRGPAIFIALSLLLPIEYALGQTVQPITSNCIVDKIQGDASTYNPNFAGWKTGGQSLATGGRYNPDAWEAALQLDLAKKYRCGYGSGRTCQVVVEAPETGKVAILLINDNGPLVSGRIIDLNERSMQYLSDRKYGRNSGVLKNVTVTILSCSLSNYLGPINARDRAEWASSIDSITPTNYAAKYPNPGNPYSPVSVTPYASQGAYAGYGGAQSGVGSSGQSPVSFSLLNAGNTSGSGQSSTGSSGSGGVVGTNSAATIIVQPERARAGAPILVSWTSVNMQPSSCTVRKNGTDFARGNEATKRDTLTSSVEYTLTCTTATGESAVSKVSVSL